MKTVNDSLRLAVGLDALGQTIHDAQLSACAADIVANAQDILDALGAASQALAVLENVMCHHGAAMQPEDRRTRVRDEKALRDALEKVGF